MKLSVNPTLEQALDNLKEGEVFYTNSWFILNPVRILFKKQTGKSSEDKIQYIPIVVEEDRLTISDKLKLEAKKGLDSNNLAQERGLYVVENGKKEKIEIKMIEKMSVWIPKGEGDRPELMWDFEIDNISTKPTFFLETGIEGTVAEMRRE
jgi:hypothetical protein